MGRGDPACQERGATVDSVRTTSRPPGEPSGRCHGPPPPSSPHLLMSKRIVLLMSKRVLLAALAVIGVPGSPAGASADPAKPSPPVLEARIWLDRGVEPVLQSGEHVRVYFRSNVDAYVALFHIDTSGRVQLLFPASPRDPEWIRGGQDYRLLRPGSTTWVVDEEPGMGYYFLLTSAEPLDHGALGYASLDGGWDLSRVGDRVYSDPYLAMDEFVGLLLPNWEEASFDLDYVTYHVGRPYSYPRFLCYNCHTEQSYSNWNPYHRACTSFRVVIYNDPYFYPSTRFQGTRVVYTRPPLSGRPQFEFKERAAGEPGSPLVRSRSGDVRGAPLPRELVGTRMDSGQDLGGDPVRPPLRGETSLQDQGRQGERLPIILQGRPADAPPAGGARGPVRGDPSSRTDSVDPPTAGTSDRPILQRRPIPDADRRSPPDTGRRSPPSAGQGPPPARPIPNRSGGDPPVRPPPTRGGGDPPARTPPSRSGGGGPPARTPPTRGGGDPPVRTPPNRGGGGGGTPPPRPPGGGGS